MAKSRKIEFDLPTLDDIFSTQEERDDAKLKRINDIPLSEIDPFPKHPFKVTDDEDMMNLAESIKERGVLTPVTLRQKEDGRYELLSGHRRKRACEIAGLETIRAEVVEMDRDEATIFMVDSNLQRTTILPSEKAFSYKMRLDAMNRQGKRTDLTCSPVGNKSSEILADDVGESKSQIFRYIRLTELTPELLEYVDSGAMALRPAVEVSYLPKELQNALAENIEIEQCTPSHAQAIKMRKMYAEGKLNPEVVESIMQEEKPNQKEKLVLKSDRVKNLFPKDLPYSKREDYVVKAMEYYSKYRQRKERDQER